MPAVNISASSVAKQFRQVLVVTALIAIASLNSWASVAVSPASETFAKTFVGVTSPAEAVTITNTGASAQAIKFVMSADFSETDNCLGSVAAGKSCVVNLFFTPTVVGSISGAASILDNSNNLLAFVGLTGSSAASVAVFPTTISFTGGTVGSQSAAKIFNITNNTTSSSVNVTSVTTNVPDYQIDTGTCLTDSLTAGASCTVTVQVTPTSATDNGAIIVTTDLAGAPPLVVKLTSAATGITNPISLTPATLTFTTTSGGTSAAQTVTVKNTSSSSVALGQIAQSSDYIISSDSCSNATLAVKNSTCTFKVQFQPAFVGSIGGSIAVPWGDGTAINTPLVVNLNGTSTAPLTIAPAKLTFASQAIGTTSAAQAITITNNSSSPAPLNVIVTPDFQIQTSGTTCPLTGGSLAASSNCVVEVQFAPTVGGSILGAINVNGSSANPLMAQLAGSASGFTLTAPATMSVAQGASKTGTITVHPTNGFSGSVNLAVTSTLPNGVTWSFGTNRTTSTSVLTLTATSTATTGGPVAVTVAGTSGGLTQTATINLTVTATKNFTLSAAPNTLSIIQGSNGTSTITVNPISGFTGSVALSISPSTPLPSGVTASFSPASTKTTSTLTLTASASATTGPATVTVQGTSGALTQTTNISLTVNPPQSFTLSASPNTLSVAQGSSNTSTISVTDVGGFSGSVSLAASGLPSGVTAGFATNPTTGSSLLTLTASALATTGGPTTVTITGTSGALTETTTIALTVTAAPNFTLSAAPSTLSITQGGSNTSTITVHPTNGFTGSVTLAASGLPSGVTAGFATNPTTGTSVLTLTASTSATTGGPTTVTITGTSGALTPETTTISLTVTPQPNFTLSAAPSTLSVAQGSSSTSTITVNPNNGFTGSVTLAASGLPSGVTAGFATNPTTGTSVLTLTASGSAATGGPTTVTITGTSGALTHTTSVSLSVTPPPNFTLSAAPSTLSVAQGSSNTSTITVNPTNGFSGSVTLAASGLPSGVTAGFATNPTTGTSLLTLTASASATIGGPTTVTITGTSGALTPETTTISLTVTPQPNFTLSAAPNTLSIAQGANGTSTITVNPTNGFTGSVTLAASGLPSGVTAGFATNPTTGTSVLTLTASALATTGGPVTVTITGTSGALTPETTTISLTVTAAPNFTLSASPNTLSIVQGSNGTSTITVTPTNGFSGSVTLAASGLPSGVTAGFATNPTTGTSVLTLTASGSATTGGPTTVTITGTSGALTPETTTISLTVTPQPNFTLSASPNTLSIVQGSNGTSTITVNPTNGFTGSVNLAASGLPSGVTAGFATNPTTGTSVLTLTASASATTGGPTTVTITGTSGALTQTTTISLTVTAAPNFTLSAAPNTLSVAQGSSNTSTITVNPTNGFTGSVTLAASGLPSGVTAGFATNPTTGTSVLTLTASASAATGGPTTVTITGTSGALTQTTTISLTVTAAGAQIVITPTSAHRGASETMVITGNGTSFGSTTTVTGTGITHGTITVNGPTSLSLPITIGTNATLGAGTVTVTTGSQVVTAPFTVLAGVPSVASISPNNIAGTQSGLSVTVTGNFTNWTTATTTANFGPGIKVGSGAAGAFGNVTVNSTTQLTATLATSGAALGYRTVQIQTTGSPAQVLTVTNGMFVENCGQTTPTVAQVTPVNNSSNVLLNAPIRVQFAQPMNSSTFTLGSTSSVFFYDANTFQEVSATLSLDASNTIMTILPKVALTAGDQYFLYLSWQSALKDACGNSLLQQGYTFTTAFNVDATAPNLIATSPVNGDTNIPISGASSPTPVVLQFDTPIDPIAAQIGFSMLSGANAVAGNFTYSVDDRTVIFTPTSSLSPNTTYTVGYTGQITDQGGNPLNNPGSFSFTTGTASDTTVPSVTQVDPPNGTFGVGLNVTPRVSFNEAVDGATLPLALSLVYADTGVAIPATVTVSANRLVATITPIAPLLPNTAYNISLPGSTYTDIAGNPGSGSLTSFFTGTTAYTTPLTVSTINPSNGQTGVPLNARIVAVMSNNVDPTTVGTGSITVTPSGGSAIGGTVSLASDGVTLTFTPSGALTASKSYSVSVSGFADIDGNPVTAFASSFTTGTSSYGGGSFSLVSTSPLNGATNVPVTSAVTFTMSNLINAASVNPNTVYVYASNNNQIVAGNYNVSGAAVTFTPLTQYPANTSIGMCVNGLTDEAGNAAASQCYSFTTTSTPDNTAPTVTITPANGSTNVGLNSQVVLIFSKSINPATITQNTVTLFNGDSPLNYGLTISRDNRTVVLNPAGNAFTPGATITVALSNGVKDLSGNALAGTSSQFTLTTALSNNAPSVIEMRPGNGATEVPANTLVTLFTSAAMNPATIAGALHVADNGLVVTGTLQVSANGQAISFAPSASFGASDTILVTLDSTAVSSSGVPLSTFSGSFTVADSVNTAVANATVINPLPGATNVPLNTIIQIEYDEPLDSTTITLSNVTLQNYDSGGYLSPNLSLIGSGQVINIAPTSNLTAHTDYQACVTNGVKNTAEKKVAPNCYFFTTGAAADTAAPTIVSLAPTNNSTNIGTNAAVSVNFSKAINPISATSSTIQLSAGGTALPTSISFPVTTSGNPDYTRVTVTPQAPLPASTQIKVVISGVTSEAGKSVAPATTTSFFTTQAQPDYNAPYVLNSSVLNGQANVPVNSAFALQFSKAMDLGSFDVATVGVGIDCNGDGIVPATISWSSDQTTIYIVPTFALSVGSQYFLYSASLQDLAGNQQQIFCNSFTTSFSFNVNPPSVVNTSPENTQTLVPVNAPVEILFSEPINAASLGQITLKTGGSAVAFTPTFTDASQLLTLTPSLTLLPNASYTLSITGVTDTAGNQMTNTVTSTFTTGATFDLIAPSVTVADPPAGATGVGTNVAPRIVFNERLNPLSVVSSSNELYYQGSVELYNNATGQYVPATVSMSSDRLTAIITPSSALQPNTSYKIMVGSGAPYYDVAGNTGSSYSSSFVTASTSDTVSASVSTISPANNQTGVPLNAQIIAVMSDEIDPTTVNSASITVTPSGGSAIAGTVTLASDGVTLTFTPSAALTASTLYNVAVGGFNDVESNPVTSFASSFTTGTGSFGSGSFTLLSTSPANGSTNVSVTSAVTFTMSNLINAASVNPNTVYVYASSSNQVVTGTYNVNGASVTFTPLASTQYPANTLMGMCVNGLTDESGNAASSQCYNFTTGSPADTTPPTVTISPANGTLNAGLNTQVVLTFSKSINPATITASSVNLLNGDVPMNLPTSISRDNRTVVINYTSAALPAGATLTATATHLITDLSGNALADTTSQFTTTAAVLNTAPTVTTMRPGIGASNVAVNTVITLFTSAPMNSGSLPGALHISQNGTLVSGTTTVGSNGQSIEFTPGSSFAPGATIQVVLDSTAQDIYGNFLSSFSASFTTAGSIVNTPAAVQAVNPAPFATNVPLNTVIQVEYNQPLNPSYVAYPAVALYDSTNTSVPSTISLTGGQVINIAPNNPLNPGAGYSVQILFVFNTDGVPVQRFNMSFTTGAASDSTAPNVLTVAPPNSAINVGTNAGVSVNFDKAINPVSVTGSSIQLSGGSVTEVPSSISFTTDYLRTIIIPQAPLPSSTQMTIAINGGTSLVTSVAGTAVAAQSTQFTTMAGADFLAPYVVNSSVQSGQTVGNNAAFALQFNKLMDPGSVDGAVVGISPTACYFSPVQASISWSADQTTIFVTPTSTLANATTYYLFSENLMDISGNTQQTNFCVTFTTGTGADTTGPVVQQISPPSGLTGVPINAPVQILFNEPVSAASLEGVTLLQGASVVPTTASLYDGNRGVQLLPNVPLTPGTVYTINVTGVVDITGNVQSSVPSQSFTTGMGTGLVVPTVVSTNPTNGQTSVPDNTSVQVVFSKPMDPASFDPNTTFVLIGPGNVVVPASVTFSPDYKTAILQPTASLTGGSVIYTMHVGYSNTTPLEDLGGNAYGSSSFAFKTQ